ncbi:MAG: hypothetical protein RQ745_04365 [Longimicrobiales bacterium]|nr:hypothetical protein [Longimicrobiales bacterium]
MNVHAVQEATDLSQPAANALTNALEAEGILVEITGKKSYRVFRFDPYLQLFQEREERT